MTQITDLPDLVKMMLVYNNLRETQVQLFIIANHLPLSSQKLLFSSTNYIKLTSYFLARFLGCCSGTRAGSFVEFTGLRTPRAGRTTVWEIVS